MFLKINKARNIDNNEMKVDLDGFELNLKIEQIKKASLDPDL